MGIRRIVLLSLAVAAMPVQSKQFSVTVGGLLQTADTSASLGVPILGANLRIDAESDLNLDERRYSPYLLFEYAIDDRHTLFADWQMLNRRSSASFSSEPISLLGNDYQAKAHLNFQLNLNIARVGYAYSFVSNDTLKLDVLAGLHIMSINGKGGIDASVSKDKQDWISIKKDASKRSLFPMPNVGLRARYKLGESFGLTAHMQAFLLSTRLLDGSLTDSGIGAYYQVSDSLKLNVAYNHYEIGATYGDSLLSADIGLEFSGPMLSLSYSF